MDPSIRAVILDCALASYAATVRFPDIVGRLAAAGVERYHADLVRAEKTYYLPSGESEVVPDEALRLAPAAPFMAAGVDAAVRASQAGSIDYREFCRRIADAGCAGYFVSIAGRRALYYGRTGETHVEPFPSGR
jgi:uncharacterized protein YbcV (DUF1398 family)